MNEPDFGSVRTPPPLTESDYASVRARVLAEIGRHERRRWIVPLQVAAAIGSLIVIAVLLRPSAEAPVVPNEAGNLTARVVPQPKPLPAETPRSAPVEEEAPVIVRKPSQPQPESEPIRIHITTADPEVRIIWIVNPEKEES